MYSALPRVRECTLQAFVVEQPGSARSLLGLESVNASSIRPVQGLILRRLAKCYQIFMPLQKNIVKEIDMALGFIQCCFEDCKALSAFCKTFDILRLVVEISWNSARSCTLTLQSAPVAFPKISSNDQVVSKRWPWLFFEPDRSWFGFG